MIVELIRDKRKIVDRISHSQIDEFVSLLQSSQVTEVLQALVHWGTSKTFAAWLNSLKPSVNV